MKKINKRQNSQEWKDWRGTGLGASDAPIVMGASPWMTPFELWLDKTQIKPKSEPSAFAVVAMRRGQQLEPKARDLFESVMKAKFPAVSAEHDNYPYLRASFDGYNEELNALVEIKCPGKEDHAKAVKGSVPSKYYPQIQMQLLISGASVCYYYSWDGESREGVTVAVKPDPQYQSLLLDTMIEFWKHVVARVPPDVSKKDIQGLVKEQQKALNTLTQISKVFEVITQEKKGEE